MPQKAIKLKRPTFIALALFAAVMGGVGGVFAVETFDRTIRGSRDLLNIADGHLVVAIPYISTRAELLRKKSRLLYAVGLAVAVLLCGLLSVYFFMRPLDGLLVVFLVRFLLPYCPRVPLLDK